MSKLEPKILIVGAGPTGLTAALALAQKGIKPRIIDKRQTPITTSNALAIQPYTLELWERMQLIGDALKQGHHLYGVTIATPSKTLGKISFDDLPTKYPFILALPQAKTERLLIQHLSNYGVEVERGVGLDNLTQKSDSVEVSCNDQTDTYSWVIWL